MSDGSSQQREDDGDLFRPTIGSDVRYEPRPWNPASQVYVAFFGGVIAVTAIAYLNSIRLHAGRDVSRRLLLIGVVALLVVAGAAYLIDARVPDADSSRYVRLAGRGIAVVAHFGMARLLEQADRRFHLAEGEYESLWGPGFGAVVAGGFAQGLLLLPVIGLPG